MQQNQNYQPMETTGQSLVNKYLIRNKYGVWLVNPAFDDEQIESIVEKEIRPVALRGDRDAVLCLITMQEEFDTEVYEVIERLAEEGDMHCQYRIACDTDLFYSEWGIWDTDFEDGLRMVRYFKNLVENYDIDVEKAYIKYRLSSIFANGLGIKKEPEEAHKWFEFTVDNFQALLNRLGHERNSYETD